MARVIWVVSTPANPAVQAFENKAEADAFAAQFGDTVVNSLAFLDKPSAEITGGMTLPPRLGAAIEQQLALYGAFQADHRGGSVPLTEEDLQRRMIELWLGIAYPGCEIHVSAPGIGADGIERRTATIREQPDAERISISIVTEPEEAA